MTLTAESTLTCPLCGLTETVVMPTDVCQWFYDCKGCGKRLSPKSGDCCVFCSYGSVPCPPIPELLTYPPALMSGLACSMGSS